MFSLCQVDRCMGVGNLVLVNGCVKMRICPRHQCELQQKQNEVVPLEGQAPWLLAVAKCETATVPQADGDDGA